MKKFIIKTNEEWAFLIRYGKRTVNDNGTQTYEFELDIENEETIGDEYHTIKELYDHRRALNIALFHAWERYDDSIDDIFLDGPYKSKLHYDETMFDGYFIVWMNTKFGQISYHYSLKHWDEFKIPVIEKIPIPFDGCNSEEVIKRLEKL